MHFREKKYGLHLCSVLLKFIYKMCLQSVSFKSMLQFSMIYFCTKTAVVKNISWYNGHLFIQQQQQQQVGEGNTNRYHGWVSLGIFFDWMNKLLLNTYNLSYKDIRMINVHAMFKYSLILKCLSFSLLQYVNNDI